MKLRKIHPVIFCGYNSSKALFQFLRQFWFLPDAALAPEMLGSPSNFKATACQNKVILEYRPLSQIENECTQNSAFVQK